MVPMTSLGVPILLSAALVFVASSISHAMLPFHAKDYKKLQGEDEVMEQLRRLGVAPGDYLFPRPPTRAAMREPAFREKYQRGPVGLMTVLPPGGNPMGRTFASWFLYCVAAGAFTALVAGLSLPADISPGSVFRLAALVAFGAHALALWPATIWYGKAWTTSLLSTADAGVYALLTGAVFAALWPRG